MRTPFIPPKGNDAANMALVGNEAEITVNTDTKTLHVHDGVTEGGVPLAQKYHIHSFKDVTNLQAALDGKADVTLLGANNGIATLDSNGQVPSAQLPSYVDDVIEAANVASLPAVGESGKIYVTIDTTPAKTWRWTGSTYAEIQSSPGSTDAVPEGSTNLYFTNARASAAAPVQSVAGRTGAVTLSASDVSGLATVATSGSYTDLSNKPTLGTAAAKNIAATGNAATTEVVMGNDSRLTDARAANGGNAATATALQTARTINGVSFDGTQNITVTAAAGTLTGTALPAAVVSSSLTSVGTLTAMTTSGNATAAAFIPSGATVPTNGMYLSAANTLAWSTNSANRLTLSATGDLTATGNVTAYSDESLKSNWAGLDANFVAKLASVKMGTFDRVDQDQRQVGVSAQSLQSVLPEAVVTNESGLLSVAYGNAALAAAVALAQEVLSLREEMAVMRDQIAALQAK